jgi:hypothetical protein
MKPMRNLALAALAALALSLAPAGSDAASPERADSFAVTHVRVFDGLRVIPDATVVVRNGRIHAVSARPPPRPGPMASTTEAVSRPACGPTCCWSRATRP